MASSSQASQDHSLPAHELRRLLLDDRREHVTKPSAYSPTWRQETHPLEDQHRTLQAKLFAVRYARERLQFVRSPHHVAAAVASTSTSCSERHPLHITTRVALSACAASEWAHAGGIAALSGAEELFFTFLSPSELVTTSEVCRRWHALARDDRLWEPLLVTPVEQYPLRRLLGLDHVRLPAIHVYAMFSQMLPALVVIAASSDCDVEQFVSVDAGARSAAVHQDSDVDNATSAAARAASTRIRHLYRARCVHLVISDDVSAASTDSTSRRRVGLSQLLAGRRHAALVFQRTREEHRVDDDSSIETHVSDPELIHDNFEYFEHRPRLASKLPRPALYGAKRMRLRVWLHKQAVVPEPVVRSLVRQLLVAVATLERVGLMHTGISLSTVLVVTSAETPVSLSSEGDISRLGNQVPAVDEPPTLMPLFQLLCNDLSNLAVIQADDANARGLTALRLPLPRAIAQMHSPQYMIRSVLGVLRSLWAHNHPDQAPAESAEVSWLALLQRHPQLFSPELRSFIEYAEFLLSQRDPMTSQLLQHSYLTGTSNGVDVIHGAPVEPQDVANEMEYLDRIQRWYMQFAWPSRAHHKEPLLFRASAAALVPSTRLGPWSILNALSETRLVTQQFVSVVAPSTATSSWVSALARSQGRCLRKLDLSSVDLPMSVLLRALRPLAALTHLRLPREATRNDNLEHFVAELCCTEFLPNLRFMDDDVRPALEALEAAYEMQFQMVDHLLRSRATVSKDTMATPSPRVVSETVRRAGLHSSAPSA